MTVRTAQIERALDELLEQHVPDRLRGERRLSDRIDWFIRKQLDRIEREQLSLGNGAAGKVGTEAGSPKEDSAANQAAET